MSVPHRRLVVFSAAAALLAACSSSGQPTVDAVDASTPSTTVPAEPVESATAQPRLAITYDGGLLVVDANTLEPVSDIALDGFNRVSPAGDDRRVFVSVGDGFRLLDTASWSEGHDDHYHHYVGDPVLASTTIAADKPGHVVPHHGRVALFDDGTGAIRILRTDALGDVDNGNRGREVNLPEAHHGVAVPLDGEGLLVTLGNEEQRTGIAILDAAGTELQRNEQCPGVHGETTAAGDAVVVGCQDGALIFRDGTITKVDAPDPYGRIGNQAGSEASPIVLGDYKTDPDAELERPERVALIDTATAQLRLVDLGTSYTFRSLGRGPEGEALVLGTNGELIVINPESGAIDRRIPVIEAWTEPDDWQQPRPALKVDGSVAYVTDPANQAIHAVDLTTDELRTVVLGETPNEISTT
ncbi:zinc metallochaperone AztD [Millisia brevis]|uniref:zinc metallochaperone AztD n=1 Tax=Millisia brevis TaxID=264148 RepID=UPI00082AC4EE|nr:zinc metallochaperone AztD [Millisia brevis]